MDTRQALQNMAEESLRIARDKKLTKPQAVIWAAKVLREAEPGVSESMAFEIVWSRLPR